MLIDLSQGHDRIGSGALGDPLIPFLTDKDLASGPFESL